MVKFEKTLILLLDINVGFWHSDFNFEYAKQQNRRSICNELKCWKVFIRGTFTANQKSFIVHCKTFLPMLITTMLITTATIYLYVYVYI